MSYKVALITMPWSSPKYPSIQIGLLKAILEKENIPASTHYFNLNWIKYIGLEKYNELCEVRDGLLSEWIFNKELFGDFKPDGYNKDYIDYLIQDRNLHLEGEEYKKDIYKIRNKVVKEFIHDCQETILNNDYSLVGFSCTFNQLLPSLCLAEKLKESNKNIHVVFGGSTFDGDFAFEFHNAFPWIDAIFNGQADRTFPEYITNMQQNEFHNVSGLSYNKDDIILVNEPVELASIDDNPYPDYVDYFDSIEELRNEYNISIIPDALLVETSRGCWWAERLQCRFCSMTDDRKKYSVKSSANLCTEIKTQMKKYGINRFYAVDRLSISDNYIEESNLSKLVDEKLNINLYVNVRPNLEREAIRKLTEAGVKTLLVGIESLNTHLLQLVGKGVSAIQNLNFLKWATFHKIQVGYFLLYNIPGEKEEDYEQMMQLIPLIHHYFPPANYQQVFIYRNSPYYNNKHKLNIELEVSTDWKYIFPSPILENGSNSTFCYKSTIKGSKDLSKTYKRLERKWIIWQEMFNKNDCFMICFENKNSIFIYDGRCRGVNKIELKQLEKEVYKNCLDKPIHKNQIIEKAGKDKEDIEMVLNKLLEKKLLYVENDIYLGLAHYLDNKEHINYFINKY